MKWGSRNRDNDPVLAVWPEYQPWWGRWRMIEYAESEEHKPAWRDRFVPTEDGNTRADVYDDEAKAHAAAERLNSQLAEALDTRQLEPRLKDSLRLKVSKALQAKRRLSDEEKLMLQEGLRCHANDERPSASDLVLPEESEEFRVALAAQLSEMPYLGAALVRSGHGMKVLYREGKDRWTKPYWVKRRAGEAAHRARIANAYGFSGSAHWGKTKAAIREILLPRANQLLKLASVQRMLAEALARGEKVLVAGNVVFWYEGDGLIGWQIKSIQPSDDSGGTAIWEQGTILSKNHGRIVVLPYVKESGETVSGHTKNAPHDGPAKPRHPDHYVSLPFKRLKDDLMIGLMGELPYE